MEHEYLSGQEDNYYKRLLNAFSQAVIAVDGDGKITFWNRHAQQLLGWVAEEVLGVSMDVVWRGARTGSGAALPEGGADGAEHYFRHKSGEIIHGKVSVTSVSHSDAGHGDTVYLFTEDDADENELNTPVASDFYTDILNNLSDAVFLTDDAGAFIYISPNVETVLGYRREEVFEFGHIDKLLGGAPWDDATLKERGELRELPLDVTDKHGKKHSLLVEVKQVAIQNATRLYACRDVTDFKAHVDALHDSEKLLRRVLDTLPVGVWVADKDGHITLSNPEDRRIWSSEAGIDADSYTQQKVWLADSGLPLSMENRAVMRAVRHGEVTLNEVLEIDDGDGGRKTILNSAAPIRDEHGNVIGGIAVNQDVTEQRRMELAERKHRTFANALNAITAALTSSLDLETVMERILDNVGRVVPHEAANISLIEGDQVRVAFWHNYGPECDVVFRSKLYPIDLAMYQRMLDAGLPQLVENTNLAKDWSDFPEVSWIRSSVGVPIRARDTVLGFLILDSSEAEFFKPPDAERLRAFAYQAAIAIENARLFSTVRDHANQLEARVVERTVELELAKDQVEAILEYSSDGIALMNGAGELLQVNPSLRRLLGIGTENSEQRTLAAFVDEETWHHLVAIFAMVANTDTPQRVELVCSSADGRTFDADLAISPLIDAKTGEARFICNVRDVTQQKLAESELRSALRREKELNDLKTRFVAMVSHEFRTPLASIQTSTDLLYSYYDRLTAERRNEIIVRVQTQIKRLTALLEDVLTIAKADTVGLVLETAPVDLKVLCNYVISDLGFSVAKNREIELRSNTANPLVVELDPKLFHRVLENLLTNAIKYSGADQPIHIDLREEGEQAIIEIRDHGIGIPESDLIGLFDAFHRANNVGDRQGTGLGLAIVKRAVDAHHGMVEVESELDVGTNFRITLPRQQPIVENALMPSLVDW
jgi:PAS domain S-box-containing protein